MEEVEKTNPLMVEIKNVLDYAFSDGAVEVVKTVLDALESRYGEEFRVSNLVVVLCMILAQLIDNQRELRRVNELVELFYSIGAILKSK